MSLNAAAILNPATPTELNPNTLNTPPSGTPPLGTPPAGTPPEWVNTLPEAYRQDANIIGHASIDSLLAEYNTLKKATPGIAIPEPGTPYDKAKEFYSKMGVPESAEKYGLALPEGFPENFPINADFLNKIQSIAHEHKISEGALKALAGEYFNLEKGLIEQGTAAAQQEMESRDARLKQIWGAEAEARAELAKKGFSQFFDANETKALNDAGILSHPDFLNAMSKIGAAMQNPVSPGAKSSAGAGVVGNVISTPQQAQVAIDAFWADKTKAAVIRNPKDPSFKMVNAELEELYRKATPAV